MRGELDARLLDQRVAGLVALRREEAEAHRAADQDRVGDLQERVDHGDLVADLGAAEHDHERVLGVLDDAAQRRDLAFEQQAGDRRRRRTCVTPSVVDVRAVAGAEGVVDVDVGELAELLGECGVVLGLARLRSASSRAAATSPSFKSVGQRFDFGADQAPGAS